MAFLRAAHKVGAAMRRKRPGWPAAGLVLLALLAGGPGAARARAVKAASVSELAGQGFEVKAVIRDALILQKGAAVYWCVLRLGTTSPMSYQSECYAVR